MTSSSASVSLTPSPEHRFSFGLWTIRPPRSRPFRSADAPLHRPGRFRETAGGSRRLWGPGSPFRCRGPEGGVGAGRLREEPHDWDALGSKYYGNERLDQLAVELLLGAR